MVDLRFSQMGSRLRRSEIREMLKLTRRPGTISFGGGLPDPEIFPCASVQAATQWALAKHGRLALQYSPTEGEPFFKEKLAAYMKRQGETVEPDEILVTASSQQALDLLGRIFLDPGDPVIVERPTYVGTLQAFGAFAPDFRGVDMDEHGVIPERIEAEIEALAGEGRKPRFIYVIPDFQNPSGVNLTLERRREVLAIASRHDLLVVEDSPYRELRFAGDPWPSLRSLDREDRVVQLKTLSKVFAPGFRLGWLVAPAAVRDKLVMAKQGADLCTSAFVSMVTAHLFADGHIERQIETSKRLYARKAAVMLGALAEHMPELEGLWWSKPEGGMFLWLRLPGHMDTVEMLAEAAEERVAYVVGSCFYPDGSGRNEMRLNYSFPTEAEIVEGIRRLARLVARRAKALPAHRAG